MKPLVLAAVFLSACGPLEEAKQEKPQERPKRPVVVSVDAGSVKATGYVGVIAARESTDVSAVFEGTLKQV